MTERQQRIAALIKAGETDTAIRKIIQCSDKCIHAVRHIMTHGYPEKQAFGRRYATHYEMAEMTEARHALSVSRAFDAIRRGV